MKKSLVLFLAILVVVVAQLQAAPIPLDIKKVVAFIYYPNDPTNASPDGTGFLVSMPSSADTNTAYGYLVTARHVLRPSATNWLPAVVVRLNRRDGTSEKMLLPLKVNGPNKNVFTHDDPTVDIAVVPFFPQPFTNYECLFLPANLVTTEADFKELSIREGSDVFFTGMFDRHLGDKRNTPITRFGKVALMTEEKIEWIWGKTDLYLMEAYSFPGNSGSPVFFHVGSERANGSFVFGSSTIKLAGVMSGCYNDIQPIKMVSVSTNQFVTPNLGISGVVPGYKIQDILLSKELKQQRGE